jgi:acyl-CoA reductase-like NAD-dependent aldehyde dehydrogenase
VGISPRPCQPEGTQTPLIQISFSAYAGVVNSVNEKGSEVGEALVRSPDVAAVSFAGSSGTGRKITAAAATTLKRLSRELGGKAPALISPETDLDVAVRELTSGSLVIGRPDVRRWRGLSCPRRRIRSIR